MNLLPKNSSEFSSESYWTSFFDKRHKSFEWYSDFKCLSPLFIKLIKDEDLILNVGCGNSTLGYDLNQRGCQDVINIDLSDLVIKQMQVKYKDHLNDRFKFLKMNVFELEFNEASFNVVVDKGTLDALAIDATEETSAKLFRMFDQIERVLVPFGRYICVTLLQEHILVAVINWIQKKAKNNFIFRIYKLSKEEDNDQSNYKSFPVFVFIATKLKPKENGGKCLFELCLNDDYLDKPLRTLNEETVIDLIKEVQKYNLIQNHIKNNSLEEELCFELFDSSNIDEFKYKFIVTEQFSRDNKLTFGAFIIPINREKEYLFATKEGRKEICASAGCQRLVFVILNANYPNYPENQEEMHQELSPRIMEFAPKAYYAKPNQKIPFLTVNDQEREIIYQNKSEFSGNFYVYDVKTDENGKEMILRQLVFSSNKNLIQSEAKLKLVKRKKKFIKVIDHNYLACLHHGAIIVGICLYNNSFLFESLLEHNLNNNLSIKESNSITKSTEQVLRILLIGLGGGCFTSFLQHNLKEIDNLRIEFDVVEIDQTMVEVSKKWFDLNENLKADKFKLNIIVEDGLVYLDKFKDDNYYNIIIFDIDNKTTVDGLGCPPLEFMDLKTLNNVKRILRSDDLSLFMLNLAARNNTIKKSMDSRIKNSFNQVYKYNIPDETNIVYYCFNKNVQLNELIDKDQNLSDRIQKFIQIFNLTVKKDDLSSIIDCCDFVTHLS